MPVPNFACKPFLQCYDTFTAGCLHIWAPLCVSTIQALSVSRLISTDINRSHSDFGDLPRCTPGGNTDCTFPLPVSLTQTGGFCARCCSVVTYLSKNPVIPFSPAACSCRQQTWRNEELVSDTFS